MALHLSGPNPLPTEIEEELYKWMPLTTLHNLSLSSKALRSAVEPHLYSTQIWHFQEDATPPLVLFQRTLLHRPELAAYVQDLTIMGNRKCRVTPQIPTDGFDRDAAASFLRATPRVTDIDAWLKELDNGSLEMFLALLFLQVPGLRSLYMDPIIARLGFEKSYKTGQLERVALGHKSEWPPVFNNLRRVTYSLFDEQRNAPTGMVGLGSNRYLSFFQQSNLEHLCISLTYMNSFEWPESMRPDPKAFTLSTLTSLDLDHIREQNLVHVLALTPRLKRLSYTLNYSLCGGPWRRNGIGLTAITNAIFPLRDTLEDLSIKASQYPENFTPSYSPPELVARGTLRGLTELHRLRRLELPYQLIGSSFALENSIPTTETIPSGIEELKLHHDMIWLRDGIRQRNSERDRRWSYQALLAHITDWLETRAESPESNSLHKITMLWDRIRDSHDFRELSALHQERAKFSSGLSELCRRFGIKAEFGRRGDAWRMEAHHSMRVPVGSELWPHRRDYCPPHYVEGQPDDWVETWI